MLQGFSLKDLAYRFLPKSFSRELRHRKHVRDLANAVPPDEAAIRKVLYSGETVLDIGANFGVYTKLFSQVVGTEGSVIVFEPVPQTFRTLSAGIERYQLKNVQAINKAVTDRVGTTRMTVPMYAGGKATTCTKLI